MDDMDDGGWKDDRSKIRWNVRRKFWDGWYGCDLNGWTLWMLHGLTESTMDRYMRHGWMTRIWMDRWMSE